MKRLKTLPFGAGRDVPREFQNRLTKKKINLLAATFLPRRTPRCLLRFSRWHNARVILTLPLSECMQQSALRSLAIVCDYMETTLFAIVCDRMTCDHVDYDYEQSLYLLLFLLFLLLFSQKPSLSSMAITGNPTIPPPYNLYNVLILIEVSKQSKYSIDIVTQIEYLISSVSTYLQLRTSDGSRVGAVARARASHHLARVRVRPVSYVG